MIQLSVTDGKIIPAGSNVGIGPYFMGRDEKIWKNPMDFNPERFDSPDERIHPYAHVAFSAGPRNVSEINIIEFNLG
jgi:cytochrome P450 family 4